MNFSRTERLRLLVFVMAMALLLLAAGCSEEPEEPEVSLDELLANTSQELAAMETVKFEMTDEKESGAKFFDATFKRVEGEVSNPDSVRIVVDVVVPGLGFAEIEIVAIGQESYIKFSRDAPWTPLPINQVPFNFAGLGVTLSELVPVMKNATIVGRESIGGASTVRVDGTIVSDDLSNLITSADSGHPIALSLWIEEDSHILWQLRIDGQIFNDDAPETTRLINVLDFNVPVDIQLPGAASGS